MGNACVFCGDDTVPLHKEHIFGDWIARLYGKPLTGFSQIVLPDGTAKTWGRRAFQEKVRIVCQENCNGGWMSKLEQQVIPILSPMILNGWNTQLPPRTQTTLAFWAVKTAMVLDHLFRSLRVIPDSECKGLYAARQALPANFVWIGFRSTPGINLVSSLKEAVSQLQLPADEPELGKLILADAANGRAMYRVTFSVGHVAFQVFGHTFPANLAIVEGPGNFNYTQRIWPVQTSAPWPPPRPIEDLGGLLGLHALFGGPPPPESPPPVVPPNRKARRAAEHPKKQRP